MNETTGRPPGAPETLPRLSASAVWIMVLMPVAYIPIMRLTFPHVGLWPPSIMAVLGLLLLARQPSPADGAVARAGLLMAVVAFAFLWPISLSVGIPGDVPKLEFSPDPEGRSWPITAISLAVLFLSITVHEWAHALTAWLSGDPTAREQGRLSLNPLRHIDLFGSIILPLILALIPGGLLFGWAKPVPVNTSRFRSPRKGRLAVSVSGVAANLGLALLSASLLGTFGILLHLGHPGMTSAGFMNPWRVVELQGLPLAGMWVLLIEFFKRGVVVNMVLLSLNILPIPPLDGFGLVEGAAPSRLHPVLARVRGWGSLLFLGLLLTKALDYLLIPGAMVALLLNYLAGAVAKLG